MYSFPQVDLVTGLAIEEACYAQVCNYDYMKKPREHALLVPVMKHAEIQREIAL